MEDQRETDLIDCLRLKLKNFLFKYALYYFQDTSYTGSLNSRRLFPTVKSKGYTT